MVTKLPDISGITQEAGLLGKAMGGTAAWKQINKRDGLELLSFLDFGSKTLGKSAGAVGTGISAFVAGIDARREFNNEQELLGVDLEKDGAWSSTAQEALRERDTKVTDAVGSAATSGAAALGGMAAASSLAGGFAAGATVGLGGGPLGVVVGGAIGLGAALVGGAVGGMAGSKVYDILLKSETKDTLALLAKVRYAQANGINDMPEEAIGAALLSTLPEAVRKKIEDRLEEKTGTRSFARAVEKEQYSVIRELMTEYDADIRAQIGAPLDKDSPFKTVAEQLTPFINSGQLDARTLVFDKDNLSIVQALYNAEQQQQQGLIANNGFSVEDSPTSNLRPFPGDASEQVSWTKTIKTPDRF